MASKVQKISIALPKEMVDHIREAVESGQYASTSEVVREAVREWKGPPKPRPFPPGYPYAATMDDLRRMAQEGLDDIKAGRSKPMDEVFDRLETKYRAMEAGQKRSKGRRR